MKKKTKPMLIEITLKSGATVEFLADRLDHGSHSITWVTPADTYPKLVHIKFDEIAAIRRLR